MCGLLNGNWYVGFVVVIHLRVFIKCVCVGALLALKTYVGTPDPLQLVYMLRYNVGRIWMAVMRDTCFTNIVA